MGAIPHLTSFVFIFLGYSTGWRDHIVRLVNLILLPNQKTCRKCKDSFEIMKKRATKHIFGEIDLGPSLDLLKWVLVQHGVFQARRNKGKTLPWQS